MRKDLKEKQKVNIAKFIVKYLKKHGKTSEKDLVFQVYLSFAEVLNNSILRKLKKEKQIIAVGDKLLLL